MLGEVEPPCRRSGRQACAPSAAVRQVHPSVLVQQLDHIADEDRLGPALQTRLVRGLDEPAELLHAVARVVAPTSVLARGRSVDADEPRSSGLLPPSVPQPPVSQPSPWRHPSSATLPHAAAPVQQQRMSCAAGLQAAPLLRTIHQITPRCGLWGAWHRPLCPAPVAWGCTEAGSRLLQSRDTSDFAFCAHRCQHMPWLVSSVRHGPRYGLWSPGYHVWVTSRFISSLFVGG
jgi:hypothetical protein